MNPPSLAELQQELQHYILNQNNNIAAQTLETEKFSRQQRLEIYSDAYQLRLLDVLQNDYPALQLILGDVAFSKLMLEFIAQYPSRHASLRWLGEKLPEFLRGHNHWQNHNYLAELAEFEWEQITLFDAEDSQSATIEDLRRIDHAHWPQLQLTFQVASQITAYFNNTPELWHSLTNNKTAIAKTTTETAQQWLLWRHKLQVLYRPLEPAEAWCLQAFSRGENFSQACAGLCEWFAEDEVPLKAVQYLQRWLQDGLVATIK